MKMDSLTEDLLTIILAKSPLKSIATSKMVCKQWKSIVESRYFYQLFQSHHKNSHSLWSLMCHESQKETIAHYGCNSWGLTGSLNSYISSFITSLIDTEGLYGHPKESVRVEAYSDVGFILISLANPGVWFKTYYVANPISREYVKIPPLVPCTNWVTRFATAGLVTQVENDVVLSYKVVLMKYINTERFGDEICFLIYSSEAGLWSFTTIQSPFCYLQQQRREQRPISVNGNLYWTDFNYTLRKYVLVYRNFYATGTESDRCRVIPFPGEKKNNKFRGFCTTSQGYLMYMMLVSEDKDVASFEHKLSVWRLKSEEWQLVSEISPNYPGFDHIHLTINPFDAKTVYFWSRVQKRLASINLDNCKIGHFECSSDGCNQKISKECAWKCWECLLNSNHRMVFLPRWLYRIPCSQSQS